MYLKTLFNIVEAQLKQKLNFDVLWCIEMFMDQ